MDSQMTLLRCPMCEYECTDWADIRFHLHTRHAKSDLVEELVETNAAGSEDATLRS